MMSKFIHLGFVKLLIFDTSTGFAQNTHAIPIR